MFLEVNDVVVVVSFRSFFCGLVVVAFIFFVISWSKLVRGGGTDDKTENT